MTSRPRQRPGRMRCWPALLLSMAVAVAAQDVNVNELLLAAEEVARLGAEASGHAQALTYQNNRLLHLLALGEHPQVSKRVFEANQHNFIRMFDEFSTPPPGSNVRVTFQRPDPSKLGAGPQFGSDVDAIVSSADPNQPIAARDVARIRALHHERAAAFARQHGVPAAGAPNADTSFLPDPGSMSEREWRQAVLDALASGEDAIYQCPLAATAEAKIRMGVPITAAEAGARAQEVSRMAGESLVTADRLDAAARSVQDPIQRQALEAQAQLQRHYAAKYMKRMVESSEVLATQHHIVPRTTESATISAAAAERTVETARQAAAVGAMSQHFTAQQTQIFVDNMAAVALETSGTATAAQAKRQIARALNNLSPAQQGEALEGLRRTNPAMARDVAQQMRGMPKPKPPFGRPPEPGKLARATQHIGTVMTLYQGYRTLATVRDAPGPAEQFVALDREQRIRILEHMSPAERDRLRAEIARSSEPRTWSQLVIEGPTAGQSEEAGRQLGTFVGGTAGAKLGVWVYGGIGAGVGTAVAGPVGAAVGGVVGGIYGGVVGYWAGSSATSDLGDTRSSWWDHNLPPEEFNRRALAGGARTADQVRDQLIRNGVPEHLAQQAADAYRSGSLDAFNSFVHQARVHRDQEIRREARLAENRRLADDHRRGREFADEAWRRTDRMEREHEQRVEGSYRDWAEQMAGRSPEERAQAYEEAGLTEAQRNELEQRLGGGIDQRWREYADEYRRMTPAQQREIREQMTASQRAELDRAIASLPARPSDPRAEPALPDRVPPSAPAVTGGGGGSMRVVYGQTVTFDFAADAREANRDFNEAVERSSQEFAEQLAAEQAEKTRRAQEALDAARAQNEAWLEERRRGLEGMGDRPRPPLDPHDLPVQRGGGITHDEPQTPASATADAGFLGGPPGPEPTPVQPGAVRYVFQSSPTVEFNPPESADGRTRVTFHRMGEVRIWAEVEQTAAGQTMRSRTREVRCQVVAPDLAITFAPAEGAVGQEARAQVTASPAVGADRIRYVWTGPVQLTGPEATFTPEREGSVALRVEARDPVHGDLIGTATGTYTVADAEGPDPRRQQLLEEGYALEQRNELVGAIGKYREAQAIEADPRVAQHIAGLEARLDAMRRAQQLVNEGYAQEQAEDLAGAIGKYEAAQELMANDGIAQRIGALRERMNRQTRAQQLVHEGYTLEQQERLDAALGKYREAHRLSANDGLARKIENLSQALARREEEARRAEVARRAERERQERARLEAERRAAAEREARERAAREQAERERAAREREAARRAELEQQERARQEAARRTTAEREARERAAREQAAREQAERERRAREQAAAQPQVSGTYAHTEREDGETWVYEMTLRQNGQHISGSMRLSAGGQTMINQSVSGSLQGRNIRFSDGTAATVSQDGRSISVQGDDGIMVLRKR